MNRIILIGNGFDLAHGLPTKYEDFINWYWEQRFIKLRKNASDIDDDSLCTLKIKSYNRFVPEHWNAINSFDNIYGEMSETSLIERMRQDKDKFEISYSFFLERIMCYIEQKGWVDIENEYYSLLKKNVSARNTADISPLILNEQLGFLQSLLAEYLTSLPIENIQPIAQIKNIIYQPINTSDIAIEKKNYYRSRHIKPNTVLLLNFNYTSTTDKYELPNMCYTNHIHGDLTNPAKMIFGYGDELDDEYNNILKLNNNEYLHYIKSIRYLESDRYRKMLQFIESAPYQIYIMGHSCGNSDRTLLNTLFEHKNCASIKPFYYQKEDGTDNYLDIVQNISRNFTDMKLMRDRVVNKTFCEPLPQGKPT